MEPGRDGVSSTSYECPVCGLEIARDVSIFLSHGKQHIFEILRQEHPEWASSGEASVEYENYYERQFHGWKTEEGPPMIIKRPNDQPDERFLESFPCDEEESLWISGRAPMEAILKSEGLSILSLFSINDFVEKKRVRTSCP